MYDIFLLYMILIFSQLYKQIYLICIPNLKDINGF